MSNKYASMETSKGMINRSVIQHHAVVGFNETTKYMLAFKYSVLYLVVN